MEKEQLRHAGTAFVWTDSLRLCIGPIELQLSTLDEINFEQYPWIKDYLIKTKELIETRLLKEIATQEVRYANTKRKIYIRSKI